ncbi:aldehyde dehydrogenase family protein [Pararhizobium sp. IMCC21322]|uniref:aldehyde dehydrogenase family protein n=1 Tax=Pararhizobium sp. IMCC21322 TaxID=3067903 RepID=UPI0027404582|nr:aldehyde dehydrogenase family protein [Pararhizobium sp. IMCC21322]
MDFDFHHYVDGCWVTPEAAKTLELCDPATELVRCRVPLAGAEDVARAVEAAHSALARGWLETSVSERLIYLHRLIAEIENRRDQFAHIISQEMGAPIDFCKAHQVEASLAHLRGFVDAMTVQGAIDTPIADDPMHRVRYEPMGVATLITPWNWPLNQIALKVGAALMAGCTMVLKPSELTPLTGHLFAQCMEATELPHGVFNFLIGGAEAGELLTAHKRVSAISFTGSTRAGQLVAAAASIGFRRLTLELGGKSPNLLFADCDIATAVRQGVAHCFRNAGQSCNAASLMLVEDGIYDEVVTSAADIADTYHADLPQKSGPHMGPLVNRAQFVRVQNFIENAIEQGARCVSGGAGRPDGLNQGYFVRPTVLVDVTPDMNVAREEVFGPVLTIMSFRDLDDAVLKANHSAYGLAAYIQSSDAHMANEAARRINAGMIQVNGNSRALGAPFGGTKSSGLGREAGIWGIRAFQELKSISGLSLTTEA